MIGWSIAWVLGTAFAGDPEPQPDGGRIYVAKCQACHGDGGKGDGAAAAALPVKPPDLTVEAFWKGKTDEQLARSIRTGKPGSTMRGYPMSDADMAALVAYLRGLAPQATPPGKAPGPKPSERSSPRIQP